MRMCENFLIIYAKQKCKQICELITYLKNISGEILCDELTILIC